MTPVKPEEDLDEDVRPLSLNLKQLKMMKEMRKQWREDLETSKKDLLEQMKKELDEKVKTLQEVAEVERRHPDHARKRQDIADEAEMSKRS